MNDDKTTKKFRVLLAGDAGAEKTAFVKRLVNGRVPIDGEPYSPTVVDTTYEYTFDTKSGRVVFEMLDTATGGRPDTVNFESFDAAIVAFDTRAKNIYDNAFRWYRSIYSAGNYENPVLVVGTKMDVVPPSLARISSIAFHPFSAVSSSDERLRELWASFLAHLE